MSVHDQAATLAAITKRIVALERAASRGQIIKGIGSPQGVIAAPVGSLYTRTDGGTGTTLYVKETGTGNTGWVAK